MELVRLAQVIATGAHYGQVDKGGQPYIEHPKAVASFVKTEDEKTVAWLHDVVEDTHITLGDLKSVGFPIYIVNAVDAITHRKGEDRQVYLDRVANNPIATQVKLADLKHNSDLTRIKNRPLEQKDYDRMERYAREIKFLENISG